MNSATSDLFKGDNNRDKGKGKSREAVSSTDAELTIYPGYCHGLSPTLNRWCPLRCVDVHHLQSIKEYEGQNIYFHLNHPIKWVRLAGLVVAIDEFYTRIVFTIDDSSGSTLEATCLAPPRTEPTLPAPTGETGIYEGSNTEKTIAKTDDKPIERISPDGPNLTHIRVGSVVKLKGSIGEFRDERQMNLKAITLLGDTNAEVKCWNETLAFRRDVLSKPWVITAEEERRCRREAEQGPKFKGSSRTEKREESTRGSRRKDEEREDEKRRTELLKTTSKRTREEEKKAQIRERKAALKAARLAAAGKFSALGI